MNNLPKRQRELLMFILYCWRDGWLPTYREICDVMGIASTNGVKCHVEALKRKRWLLEREGHSGLVLGPIALEWIEFEDFGPVCSPAEC